MIKLYPDRPGAALVRVFADLIATGWTLAWAVLGFLIYQTVMGLEVIANGITSTGTTFNSWIKQFHDASPGGIPGVTDFLLKVADALRKYSGDPLVSAGHQVHDAIIQVAIVLALLVALPPILLVLLPYGAWRWRDMRELGAALAFVRIASITGRADQARAGLASAAGSAVSFGQLRACVGGPRGGIAGRGTARLGRGEARRA